MAILHRNQIIWSEVDMKRNIAVYNNSTGIVEVMKTLFIREGLDVVSVPTLDDLLQLIKHENVQFSHQH